MTQVVNGGHTPGPFFIYGWRGSRGPFCVAGATTIESAITRGRQELAAWPRTVAKNVRTCDVIFDSEPT